MAIIDELRTPLYFAAGTADLAVRQALQVVRNTDPKAVQARFAEAVGGLDTDVKKLGETAQDLALRGVGLAAEYAVKAREKYEELAAHGEEAVKAWRGEVAEEITEIAVVVEPDEKPAEAEAEAGAGAGEEPEAGAAPAARTSSRKARSEKAAATGKE